MKREGRTTRKRWLLKTLLILTGVLLAFPEYSYFQARHQKWNAYFERMKAAKTPRTVLIRGEIRSGLAVADSFSAAGLSEPALGDIIQGLKRDARFNFKNRRIKEKFSARLDEEGRLVRFSYTLDELRTMVLLRSESGEIASGVDELPTEKNTVVLAGEVRDTFYESILSRGELPKLASIMVGIFEYDIDFVHEVRNGDTYRIFLERITHKGRVVGYGKIHAAEYAGEVTGRVRGYWFSHENRDIEGFYNEKGLKLKKFFLRAPLDVLRVTSRFGMRFHPILGRSRMHSGIDYGAPTGTAVWSVADGTVVRAGRAGGYGNMVVVKHGPDLFSKYGHLSKILVRGGQRAAQRQIIGRVGSTGLSTGPHLHFELVMNGRPVNPKNLKIDAPKSLPPNLMPRFRELMAGVNEQWDKTPVIKAGEPAAISP